MLIFFFFKGEDGEDGDAGEPGPQVCTCELYNYHIKISTYRVTEEMQAL